MHFPMFRLLPLLVDAHMLLYFPSPCIKGLQHHQSLTQQNVPSPQLRELAYDHVK